MSVRTKVAELMRSVGLGTIVDKPEFRRLTGAPLYKRHLAEETLKSKGSSQVGASRQQESGGPLVSVIVPAFNMQEYLQDAVETVLKQTYANLEVVIVDDGSTDLTPDLADEIAQRDARVKVIHQENRGLGGARNVGVEAATGLYVTFFDSDDEMPPDAISLLAGSLEKTGSGFAVGAIERYDPSRSWTPWWVEVVHSKKQEGIRGEDFPEIVWDVFVSNKLFRRDVWKSTVGAFPEGIVYEDQEPTAKLFSSEVTFDVLPDITYRWFSRADKSSLSQQKHTLADLEDRIDVAKRVYEIYGARGDSRLLKEYMLKLLGDDLQPYCLQVPRSGPEFYETLRVGTQELVGFSTHEILESLPFDKRILIEALVSADRDVFEEILMAFQDWGASWQTRLGDAGLLASLPGLSDKAKSQVSTTSTIAADVIRPVVEITGQTLREDGAALFEGYAFLKTVAEDQHVQVSAALVPEGAEGETKEPIALDVASQASSWADQASGEAYNSHSGRGFLLTVGNEAVERATQGAVPAHSPGGWLLEVSLGLGDYSWTTSEMSLRLNGAGGKLLPTGVAPSKNRLAFRHKGGQLEAIPVAPRFLLTDGSVQDEMLRLSFALTGEEDLTVSRLYGPGLTLSAILNGETLETVDCERDRASGEWCVSLDLRHIPRARDRNSRTLDLVVRSAGGLRALIAAPKPIDLTVCKELFSLETSSYGFVRLRQFAQFALVEDVDVHRHGRCIEMAGSVVFDPSLVRQQTPSFALVGPETNIYPSLLDWNGETGRYSVKFDLYRDSGEAGTCRFPLGDYIFQMLQAPGRKLPGSVWVTCSEGLTRTLPKYLGDDETGIRLSRKANQGGLGVALVREASAGGFSRTKLRERAERHFASEGPLEEAVFFESFNGQSVADSPKALDRAVAERYPDMTRYWSVTDSSVPTPAGAIPLIRYSERWFEKLARSRYLVNNNNFPPSFRKRPGQIYVQTWHGTPLKRIGNHVPSQNLSLTYRELMKREGEDYWDFLLAQSPWAGRVLAEAFEFPSEPLVVGYPRNDALRDENIETTRARVRRELGIRESQKVFLYAPTWRDNVKGPNGRYLQPLYLDLEQMEKEFGDGARVLVRSHVNTHGNALDLRSGIAIDVSTHGDVNELYLAADALITDYSSVMFDFVNTGKPIYFLAPDLDEYRGSTRGFYFDLESEAPGPVVESTEQLIEELRNLSASAAKRGRRYEEFLRKFAPLDDGRASDRVVDALFEGKEHATQGPLDESVLAAEHSAQ